MKLFNILLVIVYVVFSMDAQTYYNEYKYIQGESVEYILHMDIDHDTSTLLSYLQKDGVNVYYNYYLDEWGEPIEVVLRDTCNIQFPRVVDTTDDILTVISGYNSLNGKFTIHRVTKDGKVLMEKVVDIFDEDIEYYRVKSQIKSNDELVFSGEVSGEEGRRGFIFWLDEELNLDTLHVTDTDYRSIGGVASDAEGQVYGISVFVDYDMVNCGSCITDARFYFSSFSKDNFMDTLDLLYEGPPADNPIGKLPFTSIGDEDFLVSIPSEYVLKPIIYRYNANQGIIWKIDSLKIAHGGYITDNYVAINDGGVLHFLRTKVNDDIGQKTSGTIVSRISLAGEVLWTKKYFRYEDSGLNKLDYYGSLIYESEDHYYLRGNYLHSNFDIRPILIKIDKDGCLTDDCHIAQVEGYYPKPTSSVSHRNIWYIHDAESEERYRYTFLDRRIPEIGGTLMRSDQMSGDDWYSTGRKFSSGPFSSGESNLGELITTAEINASLDYVYDHSMDIDDELILWGTAGPGHSHHILKVIDRDTIEFLDGRPRTQTTLECYNHNIDIEPNQVTWIDYIGDPDDIFNTVNACSDQGSEVVTCFYSAGELMWTHPDYDTCAPTSIDDTEYENIPTNLYPNPTDGMLHIPEEVNDLVIYSTHGEVVMNIIGERKQRWIDVSDLESGLYFMIDKDLKYGSRVYKFVKE